jgi:hypothetical protein
MTLLSRTLRTAIAAVVLTGFALTGGGWVAPSSTLMAGSSGQPGEVDVGSTTASTLMAGSSGQPGEVDVG